MNARKEIDNSPQHLGSPTPSFWVDLGTPLIRYWHATRHTVAYWWQRSLTQPGVALLYDKGGAGFVLGIPMFFLLVVVYLLWRNVRLRRNSRRKRRRRGRTWSRDHVIDVHSRDGRERGMSLDLSLSGSQRALSSRRNLDVPSATKSRFLGGMEQLFKRNSHVAQAAAEERTLRDRSASLDLLTEQLFDDGDVSGGNDDSLQATPKTSNGVTSSSASRPRSSSDPTANYHNHQQEDNNDPSSSRERMKRGVSSMLLAEAKAMAINYYGPVETKLTYNTFTPPPTWAEASRTLLPQDYRMRLKRQVLLDFAGQYALLHIREPTITTDTTTLIAAAKATAKPPVVRKDTDVTLPAASCSLHVKPPLLGGVVDIYVKESPQEDWMEHTFDSARNAAQFQIDLLATQVVGPTLYIMFQALQLIHRGSIACQAREYVCHHTEMADDAPQGGGVAWDDAMRALGSNIPSVRVALERLWWHRFSQNTRKLRRRTRPRRSKSAASPTSNNDDAEDAPEQKPSNNSEEKKVPKKDKQDSLDLTEEYVKKRLLLGPVDFFRLFVPVLPETALPRTDSCPKRMEQLLRWRKRSARGAVLVQAYLRARLLANKGWQLHKALPTHYITCRLAYDDNVDNSERDATAKNEYYEASVSRDVLCFVRPKEEENQQQKPIGEIEMTPSAAWSAWWRRQTLARTVISRYQAFTLVGHHLFKLPVSDSASLLSPKCDPVMMIPSLQKLVESHPHLDFMVSAIFPEEKPIAYVTVAVRSLPPGIDPAFDTNFDRFVKGTKAVREKKLSIMLQLGPSQLQSLPRYVFMQLLSVMYRRATIYGREPPKTEIGPSDRHPCPLIPLSVVSETCHFGGALQEDDSLPSNYVSFTAKIDSKRTPFMALSQFILQSMERNVLSKTIYDITFALAADESDEFPERTLSTLRQVHVQPSDVALPVSYIRSESRRLVANVEPEGSSFFDSFLGNLSASVVSHTPRWLGLGAAAQTQSGRSAMTSTITTRETSETVMRELFTGEKKCKKATQRHRDLLKKTQSQAILTEDPVGKATNELISILAGIKVPIRNEQLDYYEFAASSPLTLLMPSNAMGNRLNKNDAKELLQYPLLNLVKRGDITRHYIASRCNMKKAAVRIVDSAAWRGQTFPIDTRMCRIELQNGQFFQQGRDRLDQPVFYFRNMCFGPWRKNEDAAVAAVLHRLDNAIRHFSKKKEDIKVTLIVLMGKPLSQKEREKEAKKAGFAVVDTDITAAENAGDDEDDSSQSSSSMSDFLVSKEDEEDIVENPRICSGESYQIHANNKMYKQLVDLISAHYPERLFRALIVVNQGQLAYLKKAMGDLALNSFVQSASTRAKIKVLSRVSDLQEYVARDELITIAGGTQPIRRSAYELPE